ncbi:hypothetical protein DITRI_Ditri14bG0151500 [Diplodiscus trichospermus]
MGFDFARILVSVENRSNIPNCFNVGGRDEIVKVSIIVEEVVSYDEACDKFFMELVFQDNEESIPSRVEETTNAKGSKGCLNSGRQKERMSGYAAKKNKKKRMGDIMSETPASALKARTRRKNNKDLEIFIREDQEPTAVSLDFSISDEDIDHRNSIIRRKAEAMWEVSSILGVVFDKDKEQMIAIFSKLDKEEEGGRWN